MDSDIEEMFQEIADEAQERADAIDCPKEDYVEGLKLIISQLRSSLEAAEEELG